MNGQSGRQQIFRELVKAITFEQVVETGTYRGTTTEFLAAITGAPVATVELVDRYRLFAKARLAALPAVETFGGDSRDLLRHLSLTRSRVPTLFYLDAHWRTELPLADELRIIAASWSNAVVVIDDFQVPGDRGYAFDDYGPCAALTAAYLPDEIRTWTLLYPAVPSAAETGQRCGAAFLASPALAGATRSVTSLRAATRADPCP
ncbi:hypothetical protein [Streptomyces lunaelactis]|uniref:hypothetical protein n=1 Tax=Streptomyces lunaelactis TaxID=1535768 RepID=UPI001584ECFF|nr:hypothetical protein [Streptomyces lunaelactis]NUK86716.1 hypothetical protein [Streptomyces lunaelactis]